VAGNFRGTGTIASDINNPLDLVNSFNNLIGHGGAGGLTNGTQGNIVGVADPFLDPLDFSGGPTPTHELLASSPARNAGRDITAIVAGLSTDQNGMPRFNGTVDIGSVEAPAARAELSPQLFLPEEVITYEDVDEILTGISVSDMDSPILTVAMSTGHGTIILPATTGLNTSGNGTNAVTLTGTVAKLNDALATMIYRGARNFSGEETLNVSVSSGNAQSTNGTLSITVKSPAQQALDLRAQVIALHNSGVLTQTQRNFLTSKLDVLGNRGDGGKVHSFILKVNNLSRRDILTQAQANVLLDAANILLLSVTNR
jgi:hypothetical protein